MSRRTRKISSPPAPLPGWAIYLRTSSDENQKPELSRARQRFLIDANVLQHSELPVIGEYVDVLTGKTPKRDGYQQLLRDARAGKFSYVIVERADRFGRNDTEALRAIDELNQFGVAVRFANSPTLDPMDPDDRVIVALSFTLARRESALLGIRVKGGLHAKRQSGGYVSVAPDGYINVEGRTELSKKHELGRFNHWIEQDPERACIWREAWDLLLQDQMTLEEIAEALHAKGYRYRTGRQFVQITPRGKRKVNISTLSAIFHNWTYAGWVVSERNQIPPKTVKGNWEPIISTEEFERGLEILARRNVHRMLRSRREYLLTGMIWYEEQDSHRIRLTGSTSNTWRSGGGTPYYRVAAKGGVSFLSKDIDHKVALEIGKIQVDPELIPLIRASYTHELSERMGYSRPDERTQLQNALKQVDEEESRMARLLASGKITEATWDSLWAEWQDRRQRARVALETLKQNRQFHVDNLESALTIIANIGTLYNSLERCDQKELLRQIVERVVVNEKGKVTLELRTPFAYLKTLADDLRRIEMREKRKQAETKSGRNNPAAHGAGSNLLLSGWGGRIRTPCIDRHFGKTHPLDCLSLPSASSDNSSTPHPDNRSEGYDFWENDEVIFSRLVFML